MLLWRHPLREVRMRRGLAREQKMKPVQQHLAPEPGMAPLTRPASFVTVTSHQLAFRASSASVSGTAWTQR